MIRGYRKREKRDVETVAALQRIERQNGTGLDDVVSGVADVETALTLTAQMVELDTVLATVQAWVAAHPTARVKAVTQVSTKTWIFYEE